MKSVLHSVKKGRAAVKGAMQAVTLPAPITIGGRVLKFERKIGEGGFAVVYCCRDDSDTQYALKRSLVQSREQMASMTAELELLQLLKHPHIIQLVGSDKRPGGNHTEFYILMEYAEKSVLDMMQDRHQNGARFQEREVLRIMNDICAAVAFCHSQSPPIAHRDLKIENVLLGKDRLFKLCDFGSCIRTAYEPQTYRDCQAAEEEIERNTTLCYRSPEMCDLLSKRRIDEKCDIWALGCLLFYLIFFELPFEEQKLQIINGRYTVPTDHNVRPDLIGLFRVCLTVDPAERPDIWIVTEQVETLRGVAHRVLRPANYTPQPVSIGGTGGITASPPKSVPSAPPHTAPAAPPPPVKPQAPAAQGALLSQLDWQSAVSAPVPATAPVPVPSVAPVPAPAPPKADFSMPDFDDLSLTTPAPRKDPVAQPPPPAAFLGSAPTPLDRPGVVGFTDPAPFDAFDFNPRALPSADPPPRSDVLLFPGSPLDSLGPPFSQMSPAAQAKPDPEFSRDFPASPLNEPAALHQDLFGPNSPFQSGSPSPQPEEPTQNKKAAGEGPPSTVDEMSSKLLERFLFSSTSDSGAPGPTTPAYKPISATSSTPAAADAQKLPPPHHSRSASAPGQTNPVDPFASLF